jgi:Raf kinase inhibitor-like YbhB/YbcL family protein
MSKLIHTLAVGFAMAIKTVSALSLSSSGFSHNGMIPAAYTCDGENKVPDLTWSGAPEGTQSYALIVDDPDAPSKVWVHWVVYNIPASVNKIDARNSQQYPAGLNDFGKKTYGGPCPPAGTHRYHFTLYALDTTLNLSDTPKKEQVLAAMEGHILSKVTLIGRYERRRND